MTSPGRGLASRARQQSLFRRRSVWGLRKRSVIAATAVMALAAALGSLVLIGVLSASLTAAAESNLTLRTRDVARLLDEEELDEVKASIREDRRSGEIVQVLDSAGRVIISTDRQLTSPISALRPPSGQSTKEPAPRLLAFVDPDARLVAARGVAVDRKDYVVLVSVPLEVQADSVQTVAILLLITGPLVVGLVALAVWTFVGHSLATVDQIRREVAEIDSRHLHDRVDVPGTKDEIAALAVTMNQLLDHLEANNRSQRAFFSDASHELRSPLSTLLTTAEVASLDPTGRTWVELQGPVLGEIERMGALVEDLLTLARVDSDQLQLSFGDVDLEDLLISEIQRLDAITELSITMALVPVRVRGDSRRLVQVFRNVLDNAVRHARSTVRLRMERSGNRVVVFVENDGDTVPVSERERIFERFVRLDNSRSQDQGGSGLGLAIAREIVSAHHGSLTVEGPANADWCCFEIALPADPATPMSWDDGTRAEPDPAISRVQ